MKELNAMIKKMLMGGLAAASVLALVAGIALLSNVRPTLRAEIGEGDAAERPATAQEAGAAEAEADDEARTKASSVFDWIHAEDAGDGVEKIIKIRRGPGGSAAVKLHQGPGGGVTLAELPDPARYVASKGVVVTDLVEGSAALSAGLQRGDIITAVDGVEVDDAHALHEALAAVEEGAEAVLTVLHGDETREIRMAKDGDAGIGFATSGCGGDWASPIVDVLAMQDGVFVHGIGDERVMGIEPGSAAEAAGIREGDRITAVDGQEIGEDLSLVEAFGQRSPGDRVTLSVERDAEEGEPVTLEIEATLGAHPDDAEKGFLGVHLGMTKEIEMDFFQPEGAMDFDWEGALPFEMHLEGMEGLEGMASGALVVDLEDGSPAAEAGLAEGEWITMVDGEALEGPGALAEIVASRSPGDSLRLTVLNAEGESRELEVVLGAGESGDSARLGVSIGGFAHVQKRGPGGHFEHEGSWRDHLRGILRGHRSDSDRDGEAEKGSYERRPATGAGSSSDL